MGYELETPNTPIKERKMLSLQGLSMCQLSKQKLQNDVFVVPSENAKCSNFYQCKQKYCYL